MATLLEKTEAMTIKLSAKSGDKRSWDEFTGRRRSAFDSTWESVKHSMTGNSATNPNVALSSIMNENERLLRRSKMKKTNAGVRCGETEDEKQDPEQYDDTGLYLGTFGTFRTFVSKIRHLALLRGVINAKTSAPSESADPIEMTRHWMRLNAQEGRQKKKTLVDTKASKGRKIRYDIHPKMVGFAVKRDQGSWSHQQRNQLFRGVFQS